MVYVGRGACRDCSVYGRHSFQPIKLDLSPTTLRMNLAISKTGRCVTCNDNASGYDYGLSKTDQCIDFLLSKSIAFRLSYVVEQADWSLAC